MTPYNKALVTIMLVMLIWGSSFTVTKIAVDKMPPVYFAFLRFAVASLVLLCVVFIRRKKLAGVPKPRLSDMTWMGLSGVTFYYLFFNTGMRYTTASTGALLQGFIPVIIAVLAAVFLKEVLVARQQLGILISVIGVAIIGFVEAPAAASPHPLKGNILILLCVVSWSVYTILSKKAALLDATLVATYVTVTGTLFLVPAVLVESYYQPLPSLSTGSWMAVVYLGVLGSALCYLWYNSALQHLSAGQVGNFLNLDPVLGALIAVVFLHEKITLFQIGGCLLVVAGVWLSSLKKAS